MPQRKLNVKHLVCGPVKIELDAHHKMKLQFHHQNVVAVIAAFFCQMIDCHLLIVYVYLNFHHSFGDFAFNFIISVLFLQSQNGTFVNGVLVSKQRHKCLKENDIISFGFDMTGEFNENSPIAFIYTLMREEPLCIELSDTEDDDSHHTKCHVSEHDETSENVSNPKPGEFKRQVLITVTTQPMVINPFAVLKQREMEQHGQPECGESTCLEANADDENNATNSP